MRTFGIGDTGEDVSRWQTYLASQGFDVQADGKFGPKTLAATRQMQRRMGLKPDGRVGQRTAGKQAQGEAQPLPRMRPDQPPELEQGTNVFGGVQTGQPVYTSADKEYDPNVNAIAASNRSAQEEMARQLMGQYYDTRKADLATQQPIQPYQPDFNQAGTVSDVSQVPASLMHAAGTMPNFDWAGPAAGSEVAPVPNYADPLKRDAMIRALLGVGR